ncbi:hypothetical protein [Halosimplex amylolyticum]|uniref:hypothetical protein n=1 Tax=Halosimplex amylolyticum TaxID=3396616 RepID=UPI003F54D760
MSSDEWPVVVDGDKYRPIPESWIEHGSDQGNGSPRVYAVSVARSVREMISIRYATRDGRVFRVTTTGAENPTGGGIVPASLAKYTDWPRSLVPRQYVDSVDVLRGAESVHMRVLWSDRLEGRDDQESDRRVATDGGSIEDEDLDAVDTLETALGQMESKRARELVREALQLEMNRGDIERSEGGEDA